MHYFCTGGRHDDYYEAAIIEHLFLSMKYAMIALFSGGIKIIL